MPETLEKLRPDRDLQCYFQRPSAIAAMSQASPSGFQVTGTWRSQSDWCVIEWNQDNVFEHPLMRYLPDGDLSRFVLTYDEARSNCIPMDSDVYPTVEWHALRIWDSDQPLAEPYLVCLREHAAPIEGSYQNASVEFTLSGTATAGDWVGLEFLGRHHTYQFGETNGLADAALAIELSVNSGTAEHGVSATRIGSTIRLEYRGVPRAAAPGKCPGSVALDQAGTNGNRIGVYTYASGATASWDAGWKRFSGGTSPTKWRVTLDFSSLTDFRTGLPAPTNRIRKMRWTYAADLQSGAFARSEFAVSITNWTVTGTGRRYTIAGPGSERIEDDDARCGYSGTWSVERGNYSGGSIRVSDTPGSQVSVMYRMPVAHTLYLGTRSLGFASPSIRGARLLATVDGGPPKEIGTHLPGEDLLQRRLVGVLPAGEHVVTIAHAGQAGEKCYFDFLEAAAPSESLPAFPEEPRMTLATDWDTDHSISVAPERTAWWMKTLGFTGRANYYVGALWFYELAMLDHQYASGSIVFSGNPDPSRTTSITIDRAGAPAGSATVLSHLHHVGDTSETVALAFSLEINRGYTGMWASVAGSTLTIHARARGAEGNLITLAGSTTDPNFTVSADPNLHGGVDGIWVTDRSSTPRLNRACRDWSRAYFAALHQAGIDCTASFSLELQHGDLSPGTDLVQRGPAGDPILLPTPAVQTAFNPTSRLFWREVYREMADLMLEGGIQPYLQLGEVQWWYFANDGLTRVYSGMPFYDAYTKSAFQARYGRPMAIITSHDVNPAAYPEEVAFLREQVEEYTSAVIGYVRAAHPACRFEVLYPTDVNQTAFNQSINYASNWNPANLQCLKTESFGFTFNRDLNAAEGTTEFGAGLGFPASQRSHLVGIMDVTAPSLKEARIAEGKGMESVVLWALDQLCLIGYPLPLSRGSRWSGFLG
ncbi:MAG: hypothetical protein K2X35_12015 [Bryobacteraceae bacterium]|nr:hypothetical protein [Bryobacteraceae bacterium]